MHRNYNNAVDAVGVWGRGSGGPGLTPRNEGAAVTASIMRAAPLGRTPIFAGSMAQAPAPK
jgi:hypothetical protein